MNDTPTEPDAPVPPADAPPADPPPETDWKAEARKHEKRAKENAKAAEELEKLKAKHMSDQEKAVAEAEAKGRTDAQKGYGVKLAAAEFKAAAANAGADTSGVIDLIDMNLFLTDDGEVDEKAITKAIKGLPKSTAPRGGKSGGDFGGSPSGQPKSLDAQITEAEKAGDLSRAIRLKRQKAAHHT